MTSLAAIDDFPAHLRSSSSNRIDASMPAALCRTMNAPTIRRGSEFGAVAEKIIPTSVRRFAS